MEAQTVLVLRKSIGIGHWLLVIGHWSSVTETPPALSHQCLLLRFCTLAVSTIDSVTAASQPDETTPCHYVLLPQ
jgi:hypothetical protein